jgi:hypothetical protein
VVHGAGLLDLLRGHVVRRAEARAARGERRAAGRVADQLGDAEVGDLHAALRVEEEVFRLDVAVEHAALVGVLERLADLRHHRERLGGREAAGVHRLPQVHAVHVLHEQVREAAGLAEVEHAHDAGVREAREQPALAQEALGEVRVRGERDGQELQRDQPVEMRLPGLEDEAHAARAEQAEDLELRKRGADRVKRRRLAAGRGVGGRGGPAEGAARAEALRGIGRDGGAAGRAGGQRDGVHTRAS